VGARRNDITSKQRAQIAIEVRYPDRPRGTISKLAESHNVSRQTIYDIAEAEEQVLIAGLRPGPHGPQPEEKTALVDRNRLVRGVVKLTEVGVSQRATVDCLMELLDTAVSPSWVNGALTQLEQAAAAVNARWQSTVDEMLSGDEIYSNGAPNLLVVGNGFVVHLCPDAAAAV